MPDRRNIHSVLFTSAPNFIFILKHMAFLYTNKARVLGILKFTDTETEIKGNLGSKLYLTFDFFQYIIKEMTSGKRYLRGSLRSLTIFISTITARWEPAEW